MKAIALSLLVLTTGCVGLGRDGSASESAGLRTLDVGQRTPLHEEGLRVIDNDEAWQAFWEDHTRANGTIEHEGQPIGSGSRPAPVVDFRRERVVAVFLGERPDTCYHVRVADARVSGETVVLTVREHQPDGSPGCGLSVVYPFHVVAIAAPGEVRLEHETARGPPTSPTSNA